MVARPGPTPSGPTPLGKRGLGTIQAGRFLAAFVVVLFHAEKTLALPKYLGVSAAPWARAGFSGVEFFFVLSGFVITLAHWHELRGGGDVGRFIWKRARRVYPPLWAAIVLVALAYILVPGFAGGGALRPWPIVSAFLALPQDRLTQPEPFLVVEWTLRHEIFFYAWFAIYLWRPRVGLPLGVALLLLTLAGPLLGSLAFPLDFLCSPHHLLFAFGIAVAILYRATQPRLPLPMLASGAIAFAAAWITIVIGLGGERDPAQVWLFGLGASLLILGLATLERAGRIGAPGWMVFLGDASYAIYLVHFPIVAVASKIATRLAMHVALPPFAWFLFVAALATIGGILFHLAVERPLLRLLTGYEKRRATSA